MIGDSSLLQALTEKNSVARSRNMCASFDGVPGWVHPRWGWWLSLPDAACKRRGGAWNVGLRFACLGGAWQETVSSGL